MHCKKMKFSIKDVFSKQFPGDLVKFTEEILNGKLHFLCSDNILVLKVPQSNFSPLSICLSMSSVIILEQKMENLDLLLK